MAKNYYTILGVSPTATVEEIRSAYRQRAKKYHPDHFGKDSSPFLGVQEAYDVLGDPSTRSSYDRSLRGAGIKIGSGQASNPIIIRSRNATVEPLRPTSRPMDFGRIFSHPSFRGYRPAFHEIFEAWSNSTERPPETKSERFRTLTMEIRLTRDQASRGGQVQIRIPHQHLCSTCNGSGNVGPFQCWNCSGSGFALNEFSLKVQYPPGIPDFYRIAMPLDRYGIRDLYPVLLFRISGEGDFEDAF